MHRALRALLAFTAFAVLLDVSDCDIFAANAAVPNMYGETLDNAAYGTNMSSVYADTAYANTNGRRLTQRIVFDNTTLSDYTTAITNLSANADLLGLPVDSSGMSTYTVATYTARFDTLFAMYPQVRYWEIGNEVNGSWLGNTQDVANKVYAAWQHAVNAGKTTWLTPIYEPNCWSQSWEDMVPWLQTYLVGPHPDLASQLQYLMVSYYEDDCNGHRISQAEFDSLFAQLHSMFPNAKLGFGEIGLPRRVTSTTLNHAKDILTYYYGLHPTDPTLNGWYVRGCMWWYGEEDLSPRGTKPLWPTYWTAINGY